MEELLKKAKLMYECGELRVEFNDFETNLEGITIENNDQKLIILNSRLTYEKQLKKFLHEIKHLTHIKTNKRKEKCEEEAINCSNNKNLFNKLINI